MKPTIRSLLAVALAAATFIAPVKAAEHKGDLLLIMRASPPGGSSDPSLVAYLEKSGYTVTTTEGIGQKVDLCSFDAILLSSTVRSNQFTAESDLVGRLRRSAVPLLTWENDLLDDLRFTGRLRDQDFGELETGHYAWMVKAPHPLSGSVPAGLTTWTDARTPAGWGKPGLGADIIMTWPGSPEKAMYFAYERGATMDDDFLAPARRVFLGMDNSTFERMTPVGRKLLDAAVAWTVADTYRSSPDCTAGRSHALD